MKFMNFISKSSEICLFLSDNYDEISKRLKKKDGTKE